jgi:hypothetical protein
MSTNQITNRKEDDIIRMLGPIEEVTVKMKLPAAIIEYINEVAINQISFDPSETQLRKKSKLGTQREEIEPEVTSIQTDPIPPRQLRLDMSHQFGVALQNYKKEV